MVTPPENVSEAASSVKTAGRHVNRPDSIRQVVPAEVDGPGAVLDGVVEG